MSQPTGNLLLDSLPRPQFAELAASLSHIDMSRGAVMAGPRAPLGSVYFPTSGMVSLVRHMADGAMVEVGVVGREGVVGWAAMGPADMGSIVAVVQLPVTACRVGAADLLRFIEAHPRFGRVLARAMQALFLQVSQTAACNQHHQVGRRLAKWLLMADDRSGAAPMAMTHELLAMMLGIRRAGVTEAMAALRSAGILGGANGKVEVLDRPRLEQAACECYGVISEEAQRLRPDGEAAGARGAQDP